MLSRACCLWFPRAASIYAKERIARSICSAIGARVCVRFSVLARVRKRLQKGPLEVDNDIQVV